MVFTETGTGAAEAEVIDIIEGSHLYHSTGNCFVEWAEISEEQQGRLLKAQENLSTAFAEARDD